LLSVSGRETAEVRREVDAAPLTCSSAVRLKHVRTGRMLSSKGMQYGGGSQQQIVTACQDVSDYAAIWHIKEATKGAPCLSGEPIKCGDTIRLEHMNTEKNLHSHLFDSPLSQRQEVSGFGDGGYGDEGDDWVIECEMRMRSDNVIMGDTTFYLKHVATSKYLMTDRESQFNERNCRRCPIIGENEVSCAIGKSKQAVWQVHSGFFVPERTEELPN